MATKKRKAETDVGGKMVVTKKLLMDKKAAEEEARAAEPKAEVVAKVVMSAKEKVKAMMAKYTAGLDASINAAKPNAEKDVKPVVEAAKEEAGVPGTPPRDKRLSGILKKEGEASPSRSPARSVTFPPPANMKETLGCLGEEQCSTLLSQLESLQGGSLVLWLHQLTDSVSLLDRRPERGQGVETLVTELLKLRWEDQEEEVVEAYTSFLANLVSACPGYTRAAVKALFDRFKPSGDRDKKSEDAKIFRRVHCALKSLLEVSPVGAKEEVLRMVVEAFPYYRLSPYRQVCYVSALLEMTGYVPSCLHRVVATIMEKLLRLDAHLAREQVSAVVAGGKGDPMVETLDLLMKLLLTFIRTNTHTGEVYEEGKGGEVVEVLMSVYTSHILPTYNTVHSQFLLFYLANLGPGVGARFLASTWRVFTSPTSPSITRQTAMSYLASFLSRAAIVTTPQVLGHLVKLSSWCDSYIRAREGQGTSLDFMYTDLARHGSFYSACQAIFYIFAFKHQQLTLPKYLKVVQSLKWQSLVTCSLNPLRVCLPGVVRNFAACSRYYNLAYCQAVIERNNRINLPVVGGLSSTIVSAGSKPLLLDCFFPFDPCLLPRCRTWIEPVYLQYQGLAGILDTEEETGEEEESEEDDEEEEETGEKLVKSKRQRLDSSRSSISSIRSRKDSTGCLQDILLQDC